LIRAERTVLVIAGIGVIAIIAIIELLLIFLLFDQITLSRTNLPKNLAIDFYWTDPIDAMKRSVAKLQYKDKLYTTFKPGTSALVPLHVYLIRPTPV